MRPGPSGPCGRRTPGLELLVLVASIAAAISVGRWAVSHVDALAAASADLEAAAEPMGGSPWPLLGFALFSFVLLWAAAEYMRS